MDISLCILTHRRFFAAKRLIDSVRETLPDVEVVIGDNSPEDEWKLFEKLADKWLPIYDSDLWYDGFAAVKQKIVDAASNDWCIIADPDEVWMINKSVEEIIMGGSVSVYRTRLVHEGRVQEHGRVFNRKHYRLLGIIHEELYKRTNRQNWGVEAPRKPIASIMHRPHRCTEYQQRKQLLYDNLIYRAFMNEDLSTGINKYWYTAYIKQKLSDGFEPITYGEWLRGGKR